LTDSTNAVVGTVTNQAVTTPLQATGTCDILNLTLGPLDLNCWGCACSSSATSSARSPVLDPPTGGGGGGIGGLLQSIVGVLNQILGQLGGRRITALRRHAVHPAAGLTLVGSGGVLEREPFAVPGTAAGPTRTVAKRWSQGHDANAPIWTALEELVHEHRVAQSPHRLPRPFRSSHVASGFLSRVPIPYQLRDAEPLLEPLRLVREYDASQV
jgi:hypothetical protein